MVDSLYYSSRKIPRCENSFGDYRINYQKLCYLMRLITKDLNSANVVTGRGQSAPPRLLTGKFLLTYREKRGKENKEKGENGEKRRKIEKGEVEN